jgi:hypothetical protein
VLQVPALDAGGGLVAQAEPVARVRQAWVRWPPVSMRVALSPMSPAVGSADRLQQGPS